MYSYMVRALHCCHFSPRISSFMDTVANWHIKGKFTVHTIWHIGGVEVQLHLFLTSAFSRCRKQRSQQTFRLIQPPPSPPFQLYYSSPCSGWLAIASHVALYTFTASQQLHPRSDCHTIVFVQGFVPKCMQVCVLLPVNIFTPHLIMAT